MPWARGNNGTAAPHTDFEEWFRFEYPRVQGSLILAIGDYDIAEDSAAEAFARAYEGWGWRQGDGAANGLGLHGRFEPRDENFDAGLWSDGSS